MAILSTNHKILMLNPSSGGSFTGVLTNETLTGNGTSAYPLGVNESALSPSEAESYIQTNSGVLNEVSSVVQSNSGKWNSITGVSGAYVPLSATTCEIGFQTGAGGNSLSQGSWNRAGSWSLAQGISNHATLGCFAQGHSNSAEESTSLAQGERNYAAFNSLAQGYENSASYQSLAQGQSNTAQSYAFAQGRFTISRGPGAFAQGYSAEAYGASFAQGQYVKANGYGAFAQGYQNDAGQNCFAQGTSNTAIGGLAQGTSNYVYGGVAIGDANSAKNDSFAQGRSNSAFETSVAQGANNIAQYNSLAQGTNNSAREGGLAQGTSNYASGASIAVGYRTSAVHYSQAFGVGTTANNNGMAIGAYNKTTSAAFVIGNGSASNSRSDLFVIYPDGSISAQGKISANGVELGVGGGDGEVEGQVVNYVVSNSANIQAASASAVNVYNTVNTNSASWAAGSNTPLSSLTQYGDNINFTALSSQIVQGSYPSIRFKLLNWVGNVATYFWHEANLKPSYFESDHYGEGVDYVQWVANIYARPDNAHFDSETSSAPRFMTFNFSYDPYFHEWTSAGYSAFSNM